MSKIVWKKSSRSNGGAGSNCVEVGSGDHGPILVRDTKDRDGGTLSVSRASFARFVDSVK